MPMNTTRLYEQSIKPLIADERMELALEQLNRHRPDMDVKSVPSWRSGVLQGEPDANVLHAIRADALTLIADDARAIPLLVAEIVSGIKFPAPPASSPSSNPTPPYPGAQQHGKEYSGILVPLLSLTLKSSA